MRPAGFVLAALAVVPGVLAKSAVVYFEDKNTPDTYIQKAKDDIIAKGGKITHVYSIIKYGTPPPRYSRGPALTVQIGASPSRRPMRLCRRFRPGVTSTPCGSRKTRSCPSTTRTSSPGGMIDDYTESERCG
jgi:hypothetical protein